MKLIKLRGHHISTLVIYMKNQFSEKDENDLRFDAYRKKRNEELYGPEFLQKADSLYDIILDENIPIQIEMVKGEDTMCGYCSRERTDNCKGLTPNNEDDEAIEEFGFSIGQTYTRDELIDHIFAYMQRTDFSNPREKNTYERVKTIEEKWLPILNERLGK